MTVMDALWLTGVLTNKQRADGAYQWRTRVLRTGREIIEIERRARASAEKRGKGEELAGVEESVVAQEVPEEEEDEAAAARARRTRKANRGSQGLMVGRPCGHAWVARLTGVADASHDHAPLRSMVAGLRRRRRAEYISTLSAARILQSWPQRQDCWRMTNCSGAYSAALYRLPPLCRHYVAAAHGFCISHLGGRLTI